ncbi:MAG: hypothetical protein Q9196_006051 [Gyalolechia fulgens]
MADHPMIDPALTESDQQQGTANPPQPATTLQDYASIDAFERLQSVLNSGLQQFLDANPNHAAVDAALNLSIGASERLLERLRELDGTSNQPIAADRGENAEMDQEFLSAYPDPSLPMAPQPGVPQFLPHPWQQFPDAPLDWYPGAEHDSAVQDPLMAHGTVDDGNVPSASGRVADGGSGYTEFDFDSVLPDAVLAIQYQLPYDALWLQKLGVPPHKLAEFDAEYRCKQKFEDLCRLRVIAVGDEFAVLCTDGTNGHQWRFAKVTGIERCPAPTTGSHWAPRMAILDSKGGLPVTEASVYGEKPDDIAKAIAQFYGSDLTSHTGGYSLLFVWRGDEDLGNVNKVRATYGLWQATVDNWAAKQGLNWRRRRINTKTGQFNPDPSMERRNNKAPR